MIHFFRQQLLKWHPGQKRPMPWKGESDPYLVWLSEVILQQTRVNQGIAYFEKFKRKYPTIFHLANANEDEILKDWEGLGYYSRARNLHKAAKIVAGEYHGSFPDSYSEILKLPGIGAYTAAAIASFAFNRPHVVVDGNVMRVLSRYFGIHEAIDNAEGRKKLNLLADEALDKMQPGLFNQAIMDFGALQCTPANPDCNSCALNRRCKAFAENKVNELPIKKKKNLRRKRYFNYLVVNAGGDVMIRQRIDKDIWQKLYEFPMIETKTPKLLVNTKEWDFCLNEEVLQKGKINLVGSYKQLLTHQEIHGNFYTVQLSGSLSVTEENLIMIKKQSLGNFAFPKIICCYLKDNILL